MFIAYLVLAVVAAATLLPSFIAIRMRWWLEGIRIGAASLSSNLRIRSVMVFFWITFLAGVGYLLLICLVPAALALAASLVAGFSSLRAWIDTESSQPILVVGAVVFYLLLLLGLGLIKKLFFDRGIWAAAARSVSVGNIAALDQVVAAGGQASGFGEGMLDALDMGGGF